MRLTGSIITVVLTSLMLFPDLQTIPESSGFKRTSLYGEVIDFIHQAQKVSPRIKISTLCKTFEGRNVPLVIVSEDGISTPEQMKALKKKAVLIVGNIHAGEVEGKEASLMVIRDIAQNRLHDMFKDQIFLFIPIFNADGNDKLGKNRRDKGPDLAGVRHNGQFLDLNRDYIKLESPEVSSLVELFREWDPVLFVDLHTTNGSYHREPVTYSTISNPNTHRELMDYMWNKMLPAVQSTLKKKYGTDSIPYGNFTDRENPEKGGWINDTYQARFGTNYAGLRNRFTILDENYSHADFKTRVYSAYYFILSIMEYTAEHINEMAALAGKADLDSIHNYRSGDHILTYTTDKLFDLTIKSYEFEKIMIKPEDRHKYPPWIRDFIISPTDRFRDYKIPYYAAARPEKTIDIPSGYFILPHHPEIIGNLKKHGITLERVLEDFTAELGNFIIDRIEYGKYLFQGHIPVKAEGAYQKTTTTIPAGSYFVSTRQPLARLIPELLEPEAQDSLLNWGFFNREIVMQWTGTPGLYPVYRFHGETAELLSIIE